MKRLAAYSGCIIVCVLSLELTLRSAPERFADATYLARFKAAILAEQPPRQLLILGSSMLEQGVLSKVLEHSLGVTAFNGATPNSSRELFAFMCQRAAGHPGIKTAVLELSSPQVQSKPLAWVNDAPPETTDAKIFAAIEHHSLLARQRASLRFDSLLRLFAVLLFAHTFDGSEHYGIDYVKAVLGLWTFAIPQAPAAFSYRVRDTSLGGEMDQATVQVFADCAARLRARGAKVVLVIPPTRWADPRYTYDAEVGAIGLATSAPVLDFNLARPGDAYFRDWLHLTHEGAVAFTLALAKGLQEIDAVQ